MVLPCPHCSNPLPTTAPYPRKEKTHQIVIECPACGKEVRCGTLGNEIKYAVPAPKFKARGKLRSFPDWRSDLCDLIDEACKSSYLFSARGAAICLRIALESVINIKLLGLDEGKPEKFKRLYRAMELADGRNAFLGTSKGLAQDIKDLGDKAAHPHLPGPGFLPTPGSVDIGIRNMDNLLVEVHLV